MRLYLRHGHKLYSNGNNDTHPLDPDITDEGIAAARAVTHKLLDSYPLPSKIIVSPYLRTRHTAEVILNEIRCDYNTDIPMFADPTIGEYLHVRHKNITDNGWTAETYQYNPIHPEHWNQFLKRIETHNNDAKEHIGEDIWYITHGLVIKQILKLCGDITFYPSELQGIAIQDNGDVTIILNK